jgi:hypothetical protein
LAPSGFAAAFDHDRANGKQELEEHNPWSDGKDLAMPPWMLRNRKAKCELLEREAAYQRNSGNDYGDPSETCN